MSSGNKLAILGGNKIRSTPMPRRKALGEEEIEMINQVISHYGTTGEDLPYKGIYNKRFSSKFIDFMGGNGYAVRVTSGTAAVDVALATLDLPKGGNVFVSPVTDVGPIAAILQLGLNPMV